VPLYVDGDLTLLGGGLAEVESTTRNTCLNDSKRSPKGSGMEFERLRYPPNGTIRYMKPLFARRPAAGRI